MLLLNNQHLGMVVQWEDRFYEGNRGHTYLGAGFDEEPYPDFVDDRQGLPLRRPPHHRTRTTSTPPWKRCSTARARTCSTCMVPYQEHVLPMIPGGMTVRDIIKA